MFYGGSLLKYASAEEEPAAEFAKLRRLNRSFAVIMDSDRNSAGAPIGAAKERIVSELSGQRCLAWVLDCRTIENLIPLVAWKQIVSKVHPSATVEWAGGRFDDPFLGLPRPPNKIAIAKQARDDDAVDIEVPELKDRLQELVELIRAANPPMQPIA
jgi:hypothetical protein